MNTLVIGMLAHVDAGNHRRIRRKVALFVLPLHQVVAKEQFLHVQVGGVVAPQLRGEIAAESRGVAHRQVVINHEFGYKTRYAHLLKMFVKEGERVKRGQLIGEVGSSGGSTGPHLHYEVLYLGRNVNPVNYFNRNMTSDEYRQLMENTKYNTDLEIVEN